MRRRLIALASGPILLFGSLMTTALVAPPANAASTTLCSTVSGCKTADRSTFGWESNLWTEYWGQAPGHNCTNYVAYRLITTNGMGTSRPWSQLGDAKTWGIYNASITTSTPARGSVAWWDATGGRGSAGHVAYVEDVLVDGSIIVSEDSWDTKTDTGNVDHFAWKKITPGAGWPTNFIHFKDLGAGARASQRVDFNGDGKTDIFYIAANNDCTSRVNAVPLRGWHLVSSW